MSPRENGWRNCSSCKKTISFGAKYWRCSVSTCNQSRFQMMFCSLACWDAHVAVRNHRSAWAEEQRAPTGQQPSTPEAPRRRLVRGNAGQPKVEREILIVASKLKKYIRDHAGMNTSGDVMEILSDLVRIQCNDAIDRARVEGRKTVLARDFRE